MDRTSKKKERERESSFNQFAAGFLLWRAIEIRHRPHAPRSSLPGHSLSNRLQCSWPTLFIFHAQTKIRLIAHRTRRQFVPLFSKKKKLSLLAEAPAADASAAAAAAALKAAHSRAGARVHDLMPAYYSACRISNLLGGQGERRTRRRKAFASS